jgi:arylsulfatase A-like enzyme
MVIKLGLIRLCRVWIHWQLVIIWALMTGEYALSSSHSMGHTIHHTKSLFLKFSYHHPHSPYNTPRRILDHYILKNGTKSDLKLLKRLLNQNSSSWDEKYRNFDEEISNTLNYFEDKNLLDKFLVVRTSYHGDMNGDHYLC